MGIIGIGLTIQINAQTITEKWAKNYNGTGNISDKATAMAVDNHGNSFVTGKSHNGSNLDYATVKYNSAGVKKWSVTYNGPSNNLDEAIDIVLDNAGNVYVTGKSYNGYSFMPEFEDLTQAQLDCLLEEAAAMMGWELSLVDSEGMVMLYDIAYELYLEGSCDVMVEYGSYDYVTIKYNSKGVEQWVAIYDGPSHGNEYVKAIGLDDAGNVYVTGNSYGYGTNLDWATVKYDANGVEQWVKRYNRANFNDGVSDMAVDGSGNVHVTGGSVECFGCMTENTTIKYNAAGTQQWLARGVGYAGGQRLLGRSSAITLDDAGNVYITGTNFFYPYGGQYDLYAIYKFNSNGIQQWFAQDAIVPIAEPVGIEVDDAGNVYIAGSQNGNGGTSGPPGFDNYVTIKHDANGVRQWIKSYNDLRPYSDGSVGNTQDHAKAMTMDDDGNVYVTGNSYYSGNGFDIATVKYDASGTEQWRARHNGPMNQNDDAADIAVDGSGKVYVCGSERVGTYNDYVTIKYSSKGGGHNKMSNNTDNEEMEEILLDVAEEIDEIDISIYPNPTRGAFVVETASMDRVELNIYSPTGQIVLSETLIDGAAKIDLSEYPKGIYFIQLLSNQKIENRKVVIQ